MVGTGNGWLDIYIYIFTSYMQASDGWYWKWLAKWRRKGEEIGIKEQGQLTHEELKVSKIQVFNRSPPSPL